MKLINIMLLILLLLLVASLAGCLQTKKAEPFKATNVSIINVATDRPAYSPGDTVIGSVAVENIGNNTIDKLTVWVTAKNLNYAWAGDKAQTKFPVEYKDLNLMPGGKTALNATINIPKEVSGFSTAGEYELRVEVYLEKQLCDYKVLKMSVR